MAAGMAVGLTGGIATGKSLAAETFVRLSVPVLDADRVAREVVQPGTPALAEIEAAFGRAFLLESGELDRRRMRETVFADPGARRRLEEITHPAIRERLQAWREAQTADYCVLAVPILIEMGLETIVDRVLVVDTPEQIQVRRLLDRDGITESLARQMLAAQASRQERLARAHDVIRNDGTAADLAAAVTAIHGWYLELARSGRHDAPGRRLP